MQTSWQYDENVEQRILLRGLSHIGATLSFEDWITHWSLLVSNDPVTAQVIVVVACIDAVHSSCC